MAGSKQMRLFETPAFSVREWVRSRLEGLEWRQRARAARRARRRGRASLAFADNKIVGGTGGEVMRG
jgi:hypothetical protein